MTVISVLIVALIKLNQIPFKSITQARLFKPLHAPMNYILDDVNTMHSMIKW